MSEVILKGICTEVEFESFQRKLFTELHKLTSEFKSHQEWLTSNEAMGYLRIGETKFYNLLNKGVIKQYQLDGKKLYNRNELREAIKNDSL